MLIRGQHARALHPAASTSLPERGSMTEREMEDLLWDYPEKFLNEPLKHFQSQPHRRWADPI
jgi:hypothetical protein